MRRSVSVVVAVVLLAACTNTAAPQTEREMTAEEAALLAEVQFRNYETGGADFSVSAAFLGTGESLSMTGSVDWRNHVGRASVSATGKEAGVVEVVWSSGIVLERRPALTRTLATMGKTNIEFFARRPDKTNRLLDRVIAVLVGLAAPERENALLVQQADGSAFMRSDELRGREVSVLRYGRNLRYWIDPAKTELVRFEGDSDSGTAPVVVDVLAVGQRTIEAPASDSVIDASTIRELYEASLDS